MSMNYFSNSLKTGNTVSTFLTDCAQSIEEL